MISHYGPESPRQLSPGPIERRPALPSGRPPAVSIEILMERPTVDPEALAHERARQFQRLERFRPVEMGRLGVVLQKPMYRDGSAGEIFVPTGTREFAPRDIKKFQAAIRQGLSILFEQSNLHTPKPGIEQLMG